MAELKITLPDSLFQDLSSRAEKREASVEDYIVKSLRWHIKKIKKIEAGLEDDAQTFSLVSKSVVITPDPEGAQN